MTTSDIPLLPERFADLEEFAQVWAVGDANLRYRHRLDSSMDELQAFYDAAMSRGEEMLTYLDQFELDDLPIEALNLARLLSSLSFVSFSIELFKQPRIPDCGATYITWVSEPMP